MRPSVVERQVILHLAACRTIRESPDVEIESLIADATRMSCSGCSIGCG
jgi:hypothetical protein